jgi:hypothetical protein
MSSGSAEARIAHHAVERWIERVDGTASLAEARMAVGRFVALGRARPTPRHWMRGLVRQEPGTVFVYNAERPRVCAVVVDGVVVTVLVRALFERTSRHLTTVTHDGRRPSADERARWRWNREIPALDEAA